MQSPRCSLVVVKKYQEPQNSTENATRPFPRRLSNNYPNVFSSHLAHERPNQDVRPMKHLRGAQATLAQSEAGAQEQHGFIFRWGSSMRSISLDFHALSSLFLDLHHLSSTFLTLIHFSTTKLWGKNPWRIPARGADFGGARTRARALP